jgi:lipopolysaccharide export LptBFGC system permease protein LptF
MKRSILACLAGLLTWIVVVTVINRGLRLSLPNYTVAEQTLQFTLGMKWARLLMAIVTSVAAGAVTGWISRSSRWAPLILGSVVLAMFVPLHIAIWGKFPVWYHLTFLLTIIPAVLVGALLTSRRNKDLNEVHFAPR